MVKLLQKNRATLKCGAMTKFRAFADVMTNDGCFEGGRTQDNAVTIRTRVGGKPTVSILNPLPANGGSVIFFVAFIGLSSL